MPRVYQLRNDVGEVLSYQPTVKKAKADRAWWHNLDREAGEEPMEITIHPIDYEPTREGIAALLNDRARSL